MKDASVAVISLLNLSTKFYKCNLYDITLKSGTVLRYTDYDQNVTVDGITYSAHGPTIKRGRTKLSSTISVDSVGITMYVVQTDLIGATPIMTLVHNGGFDDAECTVYICFMSAPGIVVGRVLWFSGNIDIQDAGGMEISMDNLSIMSKANIDYPSRKYYPTCPYVLYGAGCGVNIANYTVAGTIVQAVSKRVLYTSLTFTDGYYDLGGIKFTSGVLTGVKMAIQDSYAANGHLIMLVSLDALPGYDDTFEIYPGCNQLPATCQSKFNNWNRNRATPYIPLTETVT
ncbi:MAG: hypothetical protein H6Q72_4355 [Firmicutes bacterium]|nr:hypothetical protein [Bacillota bacterium]